MFVGRLWLLRATLHTLALALCRAFQRCRVLISSAAFSPVVAKNAFPQVAAFAGWWIS
jgi:hypothetical protein